MTDNNLAAQIAALLAKAEKADELQETVAKMGRIIESQNREAQWYMTRNAQLHDEIDKHLKRNAELSELCRERAKRIVALIRDTTALKREVEELKAAQDAADVANAPFNDEWDSWSDAAQACDPAQFVFDPARDKQVLATKALSKADLLRQLRETLPPDSFVFIEPTFNPIDPADHS